VGTPAYAAPEQAAGDPVDHTADLYAVGVMLYELACGRLPYEGLTAGQFLVQHLSAPVPRLPADIRATPLGQTLDAIVQRCMAKQPIERFGSAAELAATFRALAAGDFAAVHATIPPLPELRRSRRRYVEGGLALAALALVGLLFARARPPRRPAVRPIAEAPAKATGVTPPPAVFVTLTFTSEPAGAEVRGPIGELYGLTPFSRAFLRADDEQVIEVTRAGYAPVRLTVTPNAPRAVSVRLARARPAIVKPAQRFGSEKTIDPFRR
jgi:serine/threonine-protein kinase